MKRVTVTLPTKGTATLSFLMSDSAADEDVDKDVVWFLIHNRPRETEHHDWEYDGAPDFSVEEVQSPMSVQDALDILGEGWAVGRARGEWVVRGAVRNGPSVHSASLEAAVSQAMDARK
jgi:hypothetical protein